MILMQKYILSRFQPNLFAYFQYIMLYNIKRGMNIQKSYSFCIKNGTHRSDAMSAICYSNKGISLL